MVNLSEKRWVQLLADLLLLVLAWPAAFWLRFNLELPSDYLALAWRTLWCPALAFVAVLSGLGVYRHIWRYTSMAELLKLAYGVVVSGALVAAAVLMLRYENFPRSVLVLHPILSILGLVAVRTGWRVLFEKAAQPGRSGKPLLIVGSVQECADALRALRGSQQWHAVGMVSTDAVDVGRSLQGLQVVAWLSDLPAAVKSTGAAAALVASAPGSESRRMALLGAGDAAIPLLTMPRPDEWLRTESAGPRQIELEDLLGRAPVQLDVQGLSQLFSGQTVMVTGAGGSIGAELCRQIARLGAARLVCVDISEYAVYKLEQELRAAHPQLQGLYYTANVREFERLLAIAQAHSPAVVFHAAAYKHVPLMESLNEIEAVRTNVLGTLNAARVAGLCAAQRFVLISTDKAVNPTNVMGASKRLAEQLVQRAAQEFAGTQFLAVRFGNVLGSSGSVVPLFTEQIARGGPVTVTHPDIVRYFMTIPEAAQLVLQAGLMGTSGQIFVLDMGEPVKIVELARLLIRLSGKTEADVPIRFTGLRPGEKLYEELLADNETTEPTPHPKLRVARTLGGSLADTAAVAAWIAAAGAAPDRWVLRVWLQGQVPEYTAR